MGYDCMRKTGVRGRLGYEEDLGMREDRTMRKDWGTGIYGFEGEKKLVRFDRVVQDFEGSVCRDCGILHSFE
jgi:hypothetical protein